MLKLNQTVYAIMEIDGKMRVVQTKIDGVALNDDGESAFAYLLCSIYRPANRVFASKDEAETALYILQK